MPETLPARPYFIQIAVDPERDRWVPCLDRVSDFPSAQKWAGVHGDERPRSEEIGERLGLAAPLHAQPHPRQAPVVDLFWIVHLAVARQPDCRESCRLAV